MYKPYTNYEIDIYPHDSVGGNYLCYANISSPDGTFKKAGHVILSDGALSVEFYTVG
jgi:hypothetical protein